ncbi:hypothetical protein [Leptospira noguchii]|uniref:Putative lipoprotein n=2 Tax=Leptospira noguchii TaxID=28182 RepID=T0FJ50_9LEPT|nr:hypothetical protein [Leptospira noguchii]EMO53996.1 putative lipoprotein [Leptospira noguchii]EQA73423.1 putative lipoprotein [Leptospira noguchii serovar Panama str. CZ214]
MKKIICSLFILAFLTSCKECGSEKKEPEVSFEVDGVYSVHESRILKDLTKGDVSLDYGGICLEIRKPDVVIARFVGLKEVKDVLMKWSKVEEGKHKISYQGNSVFTYDYEIWKGKGPYMILMLSSLENKPSNDDTSNYTSITKRFNNTLDDCTSYKREEMNQDPDPGPDN